MKNKETIIKSLKNTHINALELISPDDNILRYVMKEIFKEGAEKAIDNITEWHPMPLSIEEVEDYKAEDIVLIRKEYFKEVTYYACKITTDKDNKDIIFSSQDKPIWSLKNLRDKGYRAKYSFRDLVDHS